MNLLTLIDAFSEVFGAVIGALTAVLVLKMSYRQEREKRREEFQQRLNGFLRALHTEIGTLYELHMRNFGSAFKARGKGELDGIYPVDKSHLIVLKSNADLIGDIEDIELRDLIVRAHRYIYALLDSFKAYNGMIKTVEETRSVSDYQDALVPALEYKAGLRQLHDEAEVIILNLLKRIDELVKTR